MSKKSAGNREQIFLQLLHNYDAIRRQAVRSEKEISKKAATLQWMRWLMRVASLVEWV